jgi:hypothetical protein
LNYIRNHPEVQGKPAEQVFGQAASPKVAVPVTMDYSNK